MALLGITEVKYVSKVRARDCPIQTLRVQNNEGGQWEDIKHALRNIYRVTLVVWH